LCYRESLSGEENERGFGILKNKIKIKSKKSKKQRQGREKEATTKRHSRRLFVLKPCG
jgi:hypothetical protein